MDATDLGGSDSGDSDDYEEVMVYVAYPDKALALNKSTVVVLSGAETSRPSCTFSGIRYDGEYSASVGTRVFYRIDKTVVSVAVPTEPNTQRAANVGVGLGTVISGTESDVAMDGQVMDVAGDTVMPAAAAAAAAPSLWATKTVRTFSFAGSSDRILTLSYSNTAETPHPNI